MNKHSPPCNFRKWSKFTDQEIIRAVELMISPDDLTIRDVAISIFEILCYSPDDIRYYLEKNEYFNAGAHFDFNTTEKKSEVGA